MVAPLTSALGGQGTTLTLFSYDGANLVLDVVAALSIDGVYYRPAYFRFEGR